MAKPKNQHNEPVLQPVYDVAQPISPTQSLNKIPQVINFLKYKFWPGSKVGPLEVFHEPVALQVYVTYRTILNPDGDDVVGLVKDMDLESFQYILEQVPTVQQIDFSGGGEPLLNPDVFKMVHHGAAYNGAQTTLVTQGHLLMERHQEIFKSGLHTLVVDIKGHRPSIYSAVTGLNAKNFVVVRDQVSQFLEAKKRLGLALKKPFGLRVELMMTVDSNTYSQIPEMVYFAEEMGVDAIRFENFALPSGESSYLTLYEEHGAVREFMDSLRPEHFKIQVTLPTLLRTDMSKHRYCQDPYTTVGVDGDCNISGCSKQLLYFGKMGKIWDGDFWNNDKYQWLRGIHGPEGTGEFEVPMPCQRCPNNMPTPGRVLNPYWVKK